MKAAGAEVEDELLAVAELDEEAGRSLLEPGHGHPGATGYDPHLVRGQLLGAREVDFVIRVGSGAGPARGDLAATGCLGPGNEPRAAVESPIFVAQEVRCRRE